MLIMPPYPTSWRMGNEGRHLREAMTCWPQAEMAAANEAQVAALQERLEEVRGQLEDAQGTVQVGLPVTFIPSLCCSRVPTSLRRP